MPSLENNLKNRFWSENFPICIFSAIAFLWSANFLDRFVAFRSVQHLIAGTVCGGVGAFLVFSLRKSRQQVKKHLVNTLGAFVLALALSEYSLQKLGSRHAAPPQAVQAQSQGIRFDGRSPFEVIADYRSKGEDYYEPIQPASFHRLFGRDLIVDGKKVVALGGVANANILLCNESGAYVSYRSDEYGFNNPRGLWGDGGAIDIAVIGDSFAHGYCVEPGRHFVDLVRSRFSRTVNLGFANNGPLTELAGMREYLAGRKVRYAFFAYYEGNDLTNLNEEKGDAILMSYQNENFSQNLASLQEKINEAVRELIATETEKAMKKSMAHDPGTDASSAWSQLWNHPLHFLFPKMYEKITQTAIVPLSAGVGNQIFLDMGLFKRTLGLAKSFMDKENGKLTFVYLPTYERYNNEIVVGMKMKDEVLKTARSLDLDVIDIEALFGKSKNPRFLYQYGMKNHYSEEGQRMIADAILGHIGKEGKLGAVAAP
ncbi:MAG: hypothetical protein HY579_05250 [Nitrospinae bacterium]|nr:hypothetical protein [Nitrospinota bacterium]